MCVFTSKYVYLGSVHLKSVGGAGKWGRWPCKFRIGFGGGPSKFRIGFGGGHVEKARDATFPNHYLFIKDYLIR